MQSSENIYFINACFASFNEYLALTLNLTLLFVKRWFLFSNNFQDTLQKRPMFVSFSNNILKTASCFNFLLFFFLRIFNSFVTWFDVYFADNAHKN